MKILLTKQVESLTGSLGSGYGYSIQRQRGGFFSKRNSKGKVPPDGHWRFIVTCAELTKHRLHITDISIHWQELSLALYEAAHFIAFRQVRANGRDAKKIDYNAEDIINLKHTFGL
jgi:hypothetical protein